jgi:xylulose-5-phosphate/fructose-6-phosphate phosphoketolase
MVVLNRISRFQLCQQALRRARRRPDGADDFVDYCDEMLAKHRLQVEQHFEDLPEVRDWTWTD